MQTRVVLLGAQPGSRISVGAQRHLLFFKGPRGLTFTHRLLSRLRLQAHRPSWSECPPARATGTEGKTPGRACGWTEGMWGSRVSHSTPLTERCVGIARVFPSC